MTPNDLRARCTCGVTLTAQPDHAADQWIWLDADGETDVADAPPGWGGPTFWDDLARDDPAGYALASTLHGMHAYPGRHVHWPAVRDRRAPGPPECCGAPMRFAPSGWVCRATCKHTGDRV